MKFVRTIAWVVAAGLLGAFIVMNWTPARVNIWPYHDGYLFFDWPVGFTALLFFALGFVPPWIAGRMRRWRLRRRINTLEASLAAQAPSPPLATSTQLDAAANPITEAP